MVRRNVRDEGTTLPLLSSSCCVVVEELWLERSDDAEELNAAVLGGCRFEGVRTWSEDSLKGDLKGDSFSGELACESGMITSSES